MPFTSTAIPDLLLFQPAVYEDERGHFFESYNEEVFRRQGIDIRFVQDNQSYSHYGVIRGLHYQLEPHAQTKLIRVITGKVLDVAVDIRQGSPTYGQYFGVELSAENKWQLLIPAGFAHGFSVLSEAAELAYKCDALYHKESEGGIRFDDPDLNIDWKVPADKAIVSSKDLVLPMMAQCPNTFQYKG
jgi:dTDP-4-dehydrorhamnose 3,5-epimerase